MMISEQKKQRFLLRDVSPEKNAAFVSVSLSFVLSAKASSVCTDIDCYSAAKGEGAT